MMKTREKAVGWGPGGQGEEGGKGEEEGVGGRQGSGRGGAWRFHSQPLVPTPWWCVGWLRGQWGACALTLPTVSPGSWLASARARGLGIH